jgi:hypothetical protein
MTTTLPQTGTAVVGYFATGESAHHAINALIDGGFAPSEIGAAFHIGANPGGDPTHPSSQDRQANLGGSLREELGTTNPSGEAQAQSFGAPGSDTTPVQPGALGGGAGTIFSGAGRPGPISGSSLANSGLPSELKSTLPHQAPLSESGHLAAPAPVPASHPTSHTTDLHESWGEKLKHIFSSDKTGDPKHSADHTNAKGVTTRESQNFGTGEGHLILKEPGNHPYSQPAFEHSFSGYGVPSEHSRSLSHRLGHGGAIITVHAGARTSEAEHILEAAGGEVRFSSGLADSDYRDDGMVEVFGTVGRDYPGYLK